MPVNFKSTKAKRGMIAGVVLASTLAYCAPPGTFRPINFEFTGTVRDKETNEPLEGAYVVAIYSASAASNFALMSPRAIHCKKTKGMYTGKDGKFHFPVEKLNYLSPGDVTAIKPGYYGNDRIFLSRDQTAETYSNRDHYLTKQNPDKPEFRFGDMQEGCAAAEYREDVEAGIQFKKIGLAEAERLNADPSIIEYFKSGISRLEAWPAKSQKN